jgi:alcohol dehydrogenase class IV
MKNHSEEYGKTKEPLPLTLSPKSQMAADALASGSPGNNPRKATQDEIVELYRKPF